MKTQWAQKEWLHNSSILIDSAHKFLLEQIWPCYAQFGMESYQMWKAFVPYIITTTSCKWNQKKNMSKMEFNSISTLPKVVVVCYLIFAWTQKKKTYYKLWSVQTLAHHNYMDLNANQNLQEISSNATPNKHRIELSPCISDVQILFTMPKTIPKSNYSKLKQPLPPKKKSQI